MKKTALSLCAGLAWGASALSGEARQINIEFKGEGATQGWGKTPSMTMTPQEDSLKLNGEGWDSKIYREISFEPGYYLLTASGKGQSLHVVIAESLTAKASFFDMNLSRDAWRTDWRPFAVDKPFKGWLIVQCGSKDKSEAFVKQIKIDKAPPPPEESGIPSVSELEKQRPCPETVRGCTCPGGANLADLRAWNGNVARKWIHLRPAKYTDGVADYAPGWEGKCLPAIEEYLKDARKTGVKVILVLDGESFQKGRGSWESPKLSGVVCELWRSIAQALLPYRDVIYAYDLYNEPLDWDQMPHAPKQWRGIAEDAVKAIREVDKETWFCYETGPGGMHWGFANMKPLPDSRVIYSVHYYSPHEFTHQGVMNIEGTDLAEIKAKLNVRYPGEVNGFLWNKESIKKGLDCVREFQLKYHVPILVGEFSVIRWAPKPDAQQYLQDLVDIFEEYQWSWIYHGFREWPGWSVEHNEEFAPHSGPHIKADYETERGKVIKAGLSKNAEQRQ